MAMKECSAFPKAPASLEKYIQMIKNATISMGVSLLPDGDFEMFVFLWNILCIRSVLTVVKACSFASLRFKFNLFYQTDNAG